MNELLNDTARVMGCARAKVVIEAMKLSYKRQQLSCRELMECQDILSDVLAENFMPEWLQQFCNGILAEDACSK